MNAFRTIGFGVFAFFLCGITPTAIAQEQPNLDDYYRILESIKAEFPSERVAGDVSSKGLETPNGMLYPTGYDSGRPLFGENLDLGFTQATKADLLWPGGSSGYNLTGSGVTIGVWEFSGYPLPTHTAWEVGGSNRMTLVDHTVGDPIQLSSHAADVASVVGADGSPNVGLQSMSYESDLWLWTSEFDDSEIPAAANAGLLISNHSYARDRGGWSSFIIPDGATESLRSWWGDVNVSTVEDHYFGFYDAAARLFDVVTHTNKYYNMVIAIGNDGDDVHDQSVDPRHYIYTGTGPFDGWEISSDIRQDDNVDNRFETLLGGFQSSKNTLSIGALAQDNAFSCAAVSYPAYSVLFYSAFGPTDDGRIKPDFTAPAMSFFRPSNADPASANCASAAGGTSYAAPVVAGGLGLLTEHKANLDGGLFRASTYKAILAHTSDDLGNVGPDYQYGWGMPDFKEAADLMNDDQVAGQDFHIFESNLGNSAAAEVYTVVSDGTPLIATLSWTDPEGTTVDVTGATPDPSWLNDPTPKLVHDVDVLIKDMTTGDLYYPWVLDPLNPGTAATSAIAGSANASLTNILDNTEQVVLNNPVSGRSYQVIIQSKGSLNFPQDYSLVLCGNSSISLPVELSSFDLLAQDGAVNLSWTTASEENNSGFEVQHKIGNGAFEVLDFVAGNGTSSESNAYEYLVDNVEYGLNQFRLKQVDFDGHFEYSKVLSYLHEVDVNVELTEAYPNPFRESAQISLVMNEEQKVKIEIFDLTGRKVLDIFEGELEEAQRHRFSIDSSNMSAGRYILRASGVDFVEVRTLFVSK